MIIKKCCITVAMLLLLSIISFCDSEQTSKRIKDPVFTDLAPDTDGLIKILLYYDMEGISGQNEIKTFMYYFPEFYNPTRELLTNDVNAVIEGLFDGGADVVHVVDGHGSGNPEPDILLEKLDNRAEMIFVDTLFFPEFDLVEKNKYDAVVAVCQHSKAGGGGFASHTCQFGMEWTINNKSINETEIIAYSWGMAGVPLIFASGDDKLKEELEYMPWIEYVTVKYAKGPSDADLRPFNEVHKEMHGKAKKAVENIAGAKAIKFNAPIKAQLRVKQPASLSNLKGFPGINFEDNTVTFEAADFTLVYAGMRSVMRAASANYFIEFLFEALAQRKDFDKIFKGFVTNIMNRWVDVESGSWTPPSSSSGRESDKKYFGYQ